MIPLVRGGAIVKKALFNPPGSIILQDFLEWLACFVLYYKENDMVIGRGSI